MPEDKGFGDLIGDLEESLFKTEDEPPTEEKGGKEEPEAPRKTLPLLIDEKTAADICKEILKEKNQKKYELMGVELIYRSNWFFTYTCQLMIKDPEDNIVDSEEIGGREAIDAINGQLADYLPEVMENEPIGVVDLEEELREIEREGTKVEPPRLKEEELEDFIRQKISGVLRGDKDNVSVAGFELLYSPVWRFWLTIKKKTHNVQVCGVSGTAINYDALPLRPKTWRDVIIDDIKGLKDPKKWSAFLKRKASGVPGEGKMEGGGIGKEAIILIAALAILLYALAENDLLYLLLAITLAAVAAWLVLGRRKKKPQPMPPPAAAPMPSPQPY